jgi:hypothetical protein
MKPNHRSGASAAEEGAASDLCATSERRARVERRRRVWWSLVYGSINPRRRAPQRRIDEGFQPTDWHSPHLLAVAVGILLLSVADAFMTITLIDGGAIEANPVMATVVYDGTSLFAILKMTMTGFGVICMVLMARYRFLRLIRVEAVMYAILIGYSGLLCYELWMLLALNGNPGL